MAKQPLIAVIDGKGGGLGLSLIHISYVGGIAIFTGIALQVGEGHQVFPCGICAGGVSPLDVTIGYLQFHFSAVRTVCTVAAGDSRERHQVAPCAVVLAHIPPLDTGAVIL